MNEMLDLIEKVIKIPSYTGNTRAVLECFDIYKSIFLNKKVYIKEVNNNGYISILFSNYNTLDLDVLSICHTDVVENFEYKMTKKDNIIYGRGVFDMKSFIIMNLLNLKYLIENNINTKFGVLVVSDEETVDEYGTKYWVENLNLKAKIVLDNDSGLGNINNIIKDNLGAITIKIIGESIFEKIRTINNIKERFGNFCCNIIDNEEIDLYFDEVNIKNILNNCMYKNTKYDILMLNNYIKNNINDKYHKIYKDICKRNGIKIDYLTSKTTDDSRFFSYKGINIISHQANGGDFHKATEWLDFDSLLVLKNIQLGFLIDFNEVL